MTKTTQLEWPGEGTLILVPVIDIKVGDELINMGTVTETEVLDGGTDWSSSYIIRTSGVTRGNAVRLSFNDTEQQLVVLR